MSYEIKIHGRIGVALQSLVREELQCTLQSMSAVQAGDMAAPAHDVRKRIKKIRATLGLLRESLGRDTYREEDASLRQISRNLAGKRDAEALEKTLKHLQRRFFSGKPSALVQTVKESLAAQERRAMANLKRSNAISAGLVALQEMETKTAGWMVADYGWKELRHAVKRSYKRTRVAYQEAHDAPTPGRLHRWRRRAKELWIHVRLLRRVCPTLMEELAQDYDVLGEFLGTDRDLFLLREALEERREALQNDSALETLYELIDLRREELLDAAFDLGARLHEDSPSDFIRDLDERRSVRHDRRRKAKKLGAKLAAV